MQTSHEHLFDRGGVNTSEDRPSAATVCVTYVALKIRGLLVVKLLWCVGNHVVVTLTLLKFLLVAVLRGNSQSSKTSKAVQQTRKKKLPLWSRTPIHYK